HVTRTGEIVFPVPDVSRANGYPSLEVDPRSGRLFVTWVDRSAGESDVYLTTSGDGGATWSDPVRVSGDPPGSGLEHFFAWSSVDPVTGAYVAGYYRSVPDSAGALRYTLAWSADGGRTFSRVPWGSAFRPGDEFLGDYTGVDVRGGVAYGAWTEVAPDPGSAGGPRRSPGRGHRTTVVVGRADFDTGG
ncbi:MAG TPA: sialidase family protein, partial [Gemmatimonadota bacterium]|nr:sialidase family protein [Gemmatimonadota bacterium]